ncbi:MAG: response regulator, partial [Acidobacteriaceae bacterium]|nr:response regulator [Acidobacteriaceae bacterium]
MRTLIVDDESAARSRLTRLLRDFPEVNIVGEASNGLEAVELLESLQPDLLFLDIQMGGMDGFSVLRSLPHNARIPLVIFATGFDQYALDAFEANALAYLLKPIEKDKLASAVQRAQLLLQSEDARRREDQNIRVALEEKAPLRKIVGRKHNRYVLLDP